MRHVAMYDSAIGAANSVLDRSRGQGHAPVVVKRGKGRVDVQCKNCGGTEQVIQQPNGAWKATMNSHGIRNLPCSGMHVQSMKKVAHDSGDGQTIYHCPFCGSGQVIANSDGTVECEFCHTSFTVQVQPEFPAFPQTINGSPVDVPGMPGQIGDQGLFAPTTEQPAGPQQDATDPDAAAQAQDGDVPDFDEDPDSPNAAPPWAKGAVLRTTSGALVDEEDFVAHVALATTTDRQQTLAQVRAKRSAR